MKVLKKQTNSKLCFICGIENEFGLAAPFYEMEDNSVVTIVTFKEKHQSYPDRTHGGIISALLDELIGRAIWITEPETFGVTTRLQMKFRRPVNYNEKIIGIASLSDITRRTFQGTGYLYNEQGEILAEATAIYFKLPIEKLGNNHDDLNIYVQDSVKEIDLNFMKHI